MPRWSRIFSRTPWTKPMTPRLPRMYRGVRGLPVGFSLATTTGSPTLNLLFTGPINSLNRPNAWHFRRASGSPCFVQLIRLQRVARADQTIDGDELGQFFFRHPLGSGGALRQDEVPNVGSAVVHSDLFTGGNLQLKHFLR